MLKKTVTYKNFNDEEITEDFYFHFTQAEIVEMENSQQGGLHKTLEKIVATKDNKGLIEIFKDVVLNAYGEKSPDGRRFIKTPEVREAFSQTNAYSDIFMELASNDVAAHEFIDAVLPAPVNK